MWLNWDHACDLILISRKGKQTKNWKDTTCLVLFYFCRVSGGILLHIERISQRKMVRFACDHIRINNMSLQLLCFPDWGDVESWLCSLCSFCFCFVCFITQSRAYTTALMTGLHFIFFSSIFPFRAGKTTTSHFPVHKSTSSCLWVSSEGASSWLLVHICVAARKEGCEQNHVLNKFESEM